MENYLRWSEDFKMWINGWSENSEQGIDFNPGANLFGTLLTETTTFAPHYLLSEFMELPLGWYTFSLYAKGGDRQYIRLKSSNLNVCDLDYIFDVAPGLAGRETTHYQASEDDDWWRIAISGEILDNKMFRLQIMVLNDDQEWEYVGTKNSGLYIYGAQFEDSTQEDGASATPGTYVHTIGDIK